MLDPDFNTADYCVDMDDCEIITSFCDLVELMVKDIKHLEAECIRTRYQLSRYLDFPANEYYRSDILSDLRSPYQDNLAYQMYMAMYYDGGDPFSFKDWLMAVERLRKGHDDDRF